MELSDLIKRFKAAFAAAPRVFKAPGRVNIIGEHTDYNLGFVLPAAIDFYTNAAISLRDDRIINIISENQPVGYQGTLDDIAPAGAWPDYILGVIHNLVEKGYNRGVNIYISSDLPSNAGLSSSAALEVAVAKGLVELSGLKVSDPELAQVCRQAENEFVGVNCGIMDQYAAVNGKKNHLVLLDCKSIEHELIPFPGNDYTIVICNTMEKHSLSSSEYNNRHEACYAGVEIINEQFGGMASLRDVSLDQLNRSRFRMTDEVYRRCRHVITENSRVSGLVEALHSGDYSRIGRHMAESHMSLRNDYEVTSSGLDILFEYSRNHPSVIGARMTGGGFGGCTINLVKVGEEVAFSKSISGHYQAKTGITAEIYISKPADGAHEAEIGII